MVLVGGILALALIAQTPDSARQPDVVTPLDAVAPPACDASDRAPDPRCDDNLDGRDTPEASAARRSARAVLAPPRAAARLVLLPMVEGAEAAERHKIFPWLRAITTSDDGKIGLRPEIQYSTGFVPSIGFLLFDRRLPEPTSEFTARFKTGGPRIIHAEVAGRGPRWLGLILGAFWDRRDDRLFAGIGNPPPGAPPAIESRYRGDIFRGEVLWYMPRGGPLTLTLRAGAEGREYEPEGVRGGPSIAQIYGALPASCVARGLPIPCTDPVLVPGFEGDRRVVYQRMRLGLDLRRPARDASGVELGLDGGVFHGVGGDPSQYARAGFDGVGQLGSVDRALLLRFVAAVAEPIARAPVPFDELVSPSGVLGIRGLPDGLLRGPSGLVGTVEYRWLISSAIDASLFVDSGAVAGSWFADLALRNFHTSIGAGLRFFPTDQPRYWEQMTSRQGLQVAWAPGESVRLLLTAALW